MAQLHATSPSKRPFRIALTALLLLIPAWGVIGCEDSNDSLFRAAGELGPLPSRDAGAGASGSPSNEDPAGPDASAGSGGAPASGGGSGGAGAAPPGDGGISPDAGPGGSSSPPPSDGSCPEQCVQDGGRCRTGTCVFDCLEPDSCATSQVLCPPGAPCEVRCGNRACASNVVCRELATCDISCEGELSCGLEVICEGTCNVSCSGARSCRGGIGGSVQLMELSCSGTQSCGGTVSCEGQECHLECSGPQSCPRVRSVATENTVTCSGQNSCATEIECFGGLCNIGCHDNSCDGDVDCGAQECNRIDLEDPDEDD